MQNRENTFSSVKYIFPYFQTRAFRGFRKKESLSKTFRWHDLNVTSGNGGNCITESLLLNVLTWC